MAPRRFNIGKSFGTRTVFGLVSGLAKKEPVRRRISLPKDVHRVGGRIVRRPYNVWIDLMTGTPVGPIDPAYSAPIMPPPQVLSVPADKPWLVQIDYRRWVSEILVEQKSLERLTAQIARQLYKDQAHTQLENPQVVELAGMRPEERWASHPQLVLLAARGDPWCLGLQQERTAAVRTLIGDRTERPEDDELLFREQFERDFGAELGALGADEVEEDEEADAIKMAMREFRKHLIAKRDATGQVPSPEDALASFNMGADDDDEDGVDFEAIDDIPGSENAVTAEDATLEAIDEELDPSALGGATQHALRSASRPSRTGGSNRPVHTRRGG